MLVESYIQKLLYTVDCVVIPDFGGIITQYQSSQVHPVKNIFQPPKKRIAFNESLKSNDGLLIHEIQVVEGISKEEATSLVEEFVHTVVKELKDKELFVLNEIGTFSLNQEQKIQFEPDSKANYLDDSFGMSELYYKPIFREEIDDDMKRVHPSQARQAVRRAPVQKRTRPASETAENKSEVAETQPKKVVEKKIEQKTSSEKTPKEKKGNKNPVFVAIPVFLLLVALGGGVIMMKKKGSEGSVEMAGVGASIVDSGMNKEEPIETKNIVESSEEVVAPISEEEVVVEETSDVTTTISASNNRYFIIGGSFEEQLRAKKMASSIEGSEVIESDGRYRVSVASFSSKQEAFSSLDNYKSDFGNDIWVFIK